MTINDVIRLRLHAQQLTKPAFTKPGEVVSWMGAVQGQDYFGALWSIGQRMKKATESEVEKAVADKTMVRTWPMRGTLHFVSPKDIRWMLKYLTPKVISRTQSYYRKAALNEKVFTKSIKLWVKALEGGKQLTRDEMYTVLEQGKIPTGETRGLFILGYAAQNGIICFGPRKGKQQTFTLLDEWLPSVPMLKKDEALAALALRYFKSHGPATIEDFMWWAGLTKADATSGVNAVKSALVSERIDKKTYWLAPFKSIPEIKPGIAYLLPTYDEFGIAYKDRSAIIDTKHYKLVAAFFTSGIAYNGKLIGVWRRILQKEKIILQIKPFGSFSRSQISSIEIAATGLSNFLGLQPEIEKIKP